MNTQSPDYARVQVEHPRPCGFGQQLAILLALCVSIYSFVSFGRPGREPTPTDQLVDAATLLFPHLSNHTPPVLASPASVKGRPDIRSFGFDLGGSTCACTMQWDRTQYWQRVFYGAKFVNGHALTAFIGVLLLQRWQWVFIYKFANEILEELAMGVWGLWAGIEPAMQLEPRYDSLVNDNILAAIPFICLACHFVYVVDLEDPFTRKPAHDMHSYKQVFTALLQYYVLNSAHAVSKNFGDRTTDVGGLDIHHGKVFASGVQLAILLVVWRMREWSMSTFWSSAQCLALIWCPFVFRPAGHPLNDQIDATLALALPGIFTSIYQYRHTEKNACVLYFALFWYTGSLAFYCQMTYSANPLIPPPDNTFYYRRSGCGLGGTGVQDSCSSITFGA